MVKKRNSVPKVFIETSVIIRFLTQDDAVKYEHCKDLFEQVESGQVRPYISNVVILEVVFVLTRLYKFDRTLVHDAIQTLLTIRNLTVIEKTNSKSALKYWNELNIKYGDCLIASQLPKEIALVTYDNDFALFPHIKTKTPKEICSQ